MAGITSEPTIRNRTCKATIDAYEGRLNDVYTEALKRQGLRGFRGRLATDGKPEVRQVRSQEARSRGGH